MYAMHNNSRQLARFQLPGKPQQFLKRCIFHKSSFALSTFFHTIFHSSTYSMSHNTSAELQLALHCLRMKNCISVRAQISAVVRACSNWTLSPAQLAKQYSKNRCYHHWYIGQTFATCRYLPSILPVVLYGCETWSLTLREERRLRVFENRVLRKVFGPKRDEVTEEWRKLHNEELNNLYSLPNIVRVVKSRRMR